MMGTLTPAAALAAQIRRHVSMHEVLPLYGIEPVECGVDDETRLQCHCPLPSHRRKKGNTFRIYERGAGHFPRWRCFSKTCASGRAHAGDDVISFVALMEDCDLQTAAIKLTEWFADEIAERTRP
jgi:hypothetical protein